MPSSSDAPVSDYAGRSAPTTSPPAVKVSREIATTIQNVAVIVAATVGLMTGKLDPGWFAVLIVLVLRNKQGVGEQSVIELVRSRLP